MADLIENIALAIDGEAFDIGSREWAVMAERRRIAMLAAKEADSAVQAELASLRAQLADMQASRDFWHKNAHELDAIVARRDAEVGRLREACMEVIAMVDSSPPAIEPIAERLITQIRDDLRAALKGEG